ncbi:hypothetical protein POM88_009551 [Heracleum sosnowskyi]|uniref:F-box domain-containing protein n=1 Tax=Heracleum sosnowskyi TaxID=360622 RepID=A0AAD8JAT8_9APIA|nr:hypothetical protein POM88_009551 [Heracleum sosnowskyi]
MEQVSSLPIIPTHKIGAKRGRASKQLFPGSCDTGLRSSLIIASAVKVAAHEDLLIQILLHVPIKTLLNFKSVSKQWLSLITNPHFVRLRNTRSTSASSLFFAISDCSNNPDYQFIPLEVTDVSPTPFKTLEMAFDPIESPHYKVVCVRRSKTTRQLFQIEIYSSEYRLWRVSGQPFAAPRDTQFQYSTYWNGSVHWKNRFIYMGVHQDEPYTLRFNIDGERVEQMPLPMRNIVTVKWNVRKKVSNYCAASYIGESGGHWYLVEHLTVPMNHSDFTGCLMCMRWLKTTQTDATVMERSLLAISLVVPEIIKYRYNRCSGYKLNILSLVRSGEEKDASFLVVEIPGGKLVRYNFADKTVKILREFTPIGYHFYNDDGLRRYLVSALPYTESLACVCDYWCKF